MSSKQPLTLDHLRSQKRRPVKTVRISTDPELAERFRESQDRLTLAKERARKLPTQTHLADEAKDLQKAHADLEKEMAANSLKFTFQSVGYKSYDELVDVHALSKEDRDQLVKDGKAEEDQVWDPRTFPKALIVAGMIEPDIGPQKDRMEVAVALSQGDELPPSLAGTPAGEMFEWINSDDWNGSEIMLLFGAAMTCNIESRVVNLGNS